MELAFAQGRGKLGVRDIELVKVDAEAKPLKAAGLTHKLINQE